MGQLSANRRLLLAKVEATYGVDPTPGAVNALMVSNLDVSPAEAETTERDLIRPYYGQSERLMTQIYGKCGFEIEVGGHSGGVIGKKPRIDDILQACGFVGAQSTKAISSITRAGSTATATIGAHTFKVGQKVSISGAVETEYNGEHTITAVTGTTFDYAVTGTPATPATGTIVMMDKYVYTPISTAIPSVTHYYNVDGVLHKITGAKGTLSLDLSVKNVPKFKFEFTGINNSTVDAAAVTPDFTDFTIPQVANTQNTTNFSLLGFGAALESLNLALNNEVTYRTLIGKQYVDILNRKVNGSMSFEATTMAEKNYWQAVKDQATGALTITHGSEHGNMVSINCPRVILDSPKYNIADNVMMLNAGVSVLPVSGNDEMTLTFE